jgi:glycosyltransferase involved in cell wall biosynthesis
MLVSIYMPTRNRADLVQRAAASVLTQTHRDIELLIVDDGSTDDTPAVLQAMANADPRVRIFRNEQSRGAPYSRNVAIGAATGAWITGIDDDDTFMPERIAALLAHWKLLESLGAEFSCLYTQDLYDNGQTSTPSSKRGTIFWHDLLEYNSVGNQIFCPIERLRGAGMFDTEMPAWQDLDVFIRVLKKFGPGRLLDAPLYRLNVDDRPDRISLSKKDKIVAAFERLSAKHPEADPRLRQALFLQAFGKLYGHRPDVKDTLRFFSFGWNFPNARRFAGLVLKKRG